MNYKLNASRQLNELASKAPSNVPQVTKNTRFNNEENKLYYAYPRFLLRLLNDQLRQQLFFPWETPGELEPLHLHLAITHHWKLEEAREAGEDDLLNLLRPELMAVRIARADVQAILESLGDIPAEAIRNDLLARSLAE